MGSEFSRRGPETQGPRHRIGEGGGQGTGEGTSSGRGDRVPPAEAGVGRGTVGEGV